MKGLEFDGIIVKCNKCGLKIYCHEPLAAQALIGWTCPYCKEGKFEEVKND